MRHLTGMEERMWRAVTRRGNNFWYFGPYLRQGDAQSILNRLTKGKPQVLGWLESTPIGEWEHLS